MKPINTNYTEARFLIPEVALQHNLDEEVAEILYKAYWKQIILESKTLNHSTIFIIGWGKMVTSMKKCDIFLRKFRKALEYRTDGTILTKYQLKIPDEELASIITKIERIRSVYYEYYINLRKRKAEKRNVKQD